MLFRKNLALAFAVSIFAVTAAHAQSPLAVSDAELAVPFGAAKGQVAVVGSQMVFVAAGDPKASMSIERAEIAGVNRSGDVVTITTRGSIRETNTFRFRLSQPAALMAWYETAGTSVAMTPTPSAVLASYQVKHDHRVGSCQGTLVITEERVAFESIDEIDDSRQWQLVDIKKVEQNGIYKLKVEAFRDDTFNFELLGKGMDSGEFRLLVDRIARARTSR